MKIFRHIKSLTVAALALALICTAFATTKVSAEEAKMATFTCTIGSDVYTYVVPATSGAIKVSDVWDGLKKCNDLLKNSQFEKKSV